MRGGPRPRGRRRVRRERRPYQFFFVLTFKALNAGDPELAGASTVAAQPMVAATPPPPPPRITTDELHDELTKLDDLRKKGLLTDAEFDALKQKLLSRF